MRYINNAVFVSDTHCGCRSAIYPCDDKNPVILDQGVIHQPTELQKEIYYKGWLPFWNDFVPECCHGEPFVLVNVGDGVDGVHHGAVTQITHNKTDQIRIAAALFRPILANPLCKALFWIRGTEAHSDPSSQLEESLAEKLGAIKDQYGQNSRYIIWLRIGGPNGCLIHAAHNIGVTGRTHYETSAVMAELAEGYTESGRWNRQTADVIIRAHRHRYVEVRAPSARGYSISLVLPGWQGATPFTRKIAGGRQSEPQFGGVVVRQGDHDHYTRSFVVSVEREPEVIVELTDGGEYATDQPREL